MTYNEAIDWLYSTQQFGIKLGLEQPRRLLRETLAFPKLGVKVVHVAGTNGKGSTCAIIDALAQACGTRTGLFTSPHLIDFRERIQVNGRHIPETTTASYLTDIKELVSDWEHHPTFFELTLAVAMRHFREQACELIILETGMGGRLDATTAVPADIAVITPVALDHSQWLGDTLTEVAGEKAGIIVAGKPVISSPQQPAAQSVIEQEANELLSPVEFITEPLTGYGINLRGRHQQENAAVAVAALHKIGQPLNSDNVRQALSTVTWPGRFESIPHTSITLDGAHNPHAANALAATWKQEFPNQKASLIFGAVEDKNTADVLAQLTPIAQHIHLVPIDSPRALGCDQLAAALPADAPPHTRHKSLREAIANAQSVTSPILITGSLFLIGQTKAYLSETITRTSNQ
ncbi:MAG: bifunctional folylpolyglutamate synthase/dihydrofolate synthase [Verrucomicrobiae bacterium]|nr:bifunctional folylpolyglutamate synthase/dihydrofolate synthase [Verrucomicrobiae bacterium]NNJ43531.1 bifunctional folylpolyglutamate synthase/dihydrofolate synthase [Akkermansiaceae bacterium]